MIKTRVVVLNSIFNVQATEPLQRPALVAELPPSPLERDALLPQVPVLLSLLHGEEMSAVHLSNVHFLADGVQ